MPTAKPSLDLVRSVTDEHVLRALMDHRRLTRAELAAHIGISKPTASESVRRLSEAGLVHDTGDRTTGRGRAGSYYALAHDLGHALVVSIAPEGVVAETVDVHGDVLARTVKAVPHTTRPGVVRRTLQTALAGGGPARSQVRVAVVSAADPVDRRTGQLVHLPDAPFLVGELDAAAALARHVQGPVTVDNDVNWAARAERLAGDAGEPLDDFAYLYLGEGLGCAVVNDGEVRRGHTGVAGEVAHVLTTGPRGRAMAFTEVFAELGLRQLGTTAIDVETLTATVGSGDAAARRLLTSLGQAVSGVLAAVVALADPQVVVMGGSWGNHPGVFESVESAFRRHRRSAPLRAATVTDEPALTGARQHAYEELRRDVLRSQHA
jgi:predicted NBD/HSP70 family sugar kinase